jgi:type I restriction enzyme S subunit
MFGDPVTANYSKVPLKELSVIVGDGLHGTPNYSEDGECCFINGNNLVEGKIVFYKSSKFVDAEEKRKYYVELDYNTLLVSINGTLGKTAYYNGENIILGKSACYIRLKEEVNKVYIYNILCSDYFKKYAQENATGSTIRNVSLKTMRNFLIPMPPIEKQNEYMEKIEAIEKQKALIKQSIPETEELFNSRMDYYFS